MMNRPPLQQRSRRTLAALVEAAETLLDVRPFADISIQDICARAGCTTGSFYGRFSSKDDLLPYLYDKYDAAIVDKMEAALASDVWAAMSLREVLGYYIKETIASYLARPFLMREVTLFARRSPERISPETRRRRDVLHGSFAAIVVGKSGATESDAAFALFTVTTIARELCVFSHAPMARSALVSRDALADRLTRMALAYLSESEA